MDVINIDALIAQDKVLDVSDVDPNEDYFVIAKRDSKGYKGTRATEYPIWAIKASALINPSLGNSGDFYKMNNLGQAVWAPGSSLNDVMLISNVVTLPFISPNGLHKIEITNTKIKFTGLINASGTPTSPLGLSVGDVWNNAGILTII